MSRTVCLIGILLFAMVPVTSGEPVDGSSWSSKKVEPAHGNEPGILEISQAFVAGRRACVIVIGDHKSVAELEVKVYEKQTLVAERRGLAPSQDFVAVMWYPPRQETYRIEVRNYGKDYNACSIAIK
jgi:hypothetical protein